jgi:hypothetical protein
MEESRPGLTNIKTPLTSRVVTGPRAQPRFPGSRSLLPQPSYVAKIRRAPPVTTHTIIYADKISRCHAHITDPSTWSTLSVDHF